MTELSKAFRNRCEAISMHWRIHLALRAFDHLPASELADACGVLVRRPDQLDMPKEVLDYFLARENWSGFLFPTTPPIIVYHPGQSETRYESTVMHELAHLLLGHPLERVYLAPDAVGIRSFNPQMEKEAAYLGSCLQIPRRGLYWAIQKGMDDAEIALHFKASHALVQWRRNAVNAA